MGCTPSHGQAKGPTSNLNKGATSNSDKISSDKLASVTACPPLAAGDLHTVIILHTRSLALACGDNHFGQCTVPRLPQGQRPVAVAAGRNHSVVLLDNGQVVAFGRNDDGQCLVPPFPPGRRAISVAAGDLHTVVLLDNRDVLAFGWNGNGQCDVPPLAGTGRAALVAAGGSHTVILLTDGQVIAIGNDSYGQCTIPVFPGKVKAVSVAAGGYHTVVLLNNGRVMAFGWNCCGQCEVPAFPPGRRATAVAAGESHTVVLLDNGQVIAFGENDSGQCIVPVLPEGQRVVAIAAGGSHTAILLNEERVLAFGDDREGQCTVKAALADKPSVASETALDLSRRSISVRCLLHFFHAVARGRFGLHQDATTQEVTEDIVVRMTAEEKSSYVDFLERRKGIEARVDGVVTHVAHSWQMRFVDLLRAILRHASCGDLWQLGSNFEEACRLYGPFLDKRYWICLFCVNEHRSICGDPHIRCACNLEKFTEASPRCEYDKFQSVAEKLHERGGSMIVAFDKDLHALKRAWVMEEMHVALDCGMHMDVSFGTLPAANTLRRYACDIESGEGRAADKARILNRAREKVSGGLMEFNRVITDFVRMAELRLAATARKEAAVEDARTQSEPTWPDTKRPTNSGRRRPR